LATASAGRLGGLAAAVGCRSPGSPSDLRIRRRGLASGLVTPGSGPTFAGPIGGAGCTAAEAEGTAGWAGGVNSFGARMGKFAIVGRPKLGGLWGTPVGRPGATVAGPW
jgi:hypothetical protein